MKGFSPLQFEQQGDFFEDVGNGFAGHGGEDVGYQRARLTTGAPSSMVSGGWTRTVAPAGRPPRISVWRPSVWPASTVVLRAVPLSKTKVFHVLPSRNKRAGGHLQDIVAVPDGDAYLDAVAVAEETGIGGRLDEVGEDDDALFLDAEGGDFGEGGGLDAADAALQRGLAAPLFDGNHGSGADGDGIAGEDFGLDFDVGGDRRFQ